MGSLSHPSSAVAPETSAANQSGAHLWLGDLGGLQGSGGGPSRAGPLVDVPQSPAGVQSRPSAQA